jgi:hypothetical protein
LKSARLIERCPEEMAALLMRLAR